MHRDSTHKARSLLCKGITHQEGHQHAGQHTQGGSLRRRDSTHETSPKPPVQPRDAGSGHGMANRHAALAAEEAADEAPAARLKTHPGLIIPNIQFINLQGDDRALPERLPAALSPRACHAVKLCQLLPGK